MATFSPRPSARFRSTKYSAALNQSGTWTSGTTDLLGARDAVSVYPGGTCSRGESMPASVYVIRDLVKTYKAGKVRANDGLSFDIHEGEIFGLLGPNGAGKSTLVGQITGLLRPDSGTLELYGRDITRDSRFATEVVAALTQTPLPLGDLSVWEVLLITGHLRGLSRRDARTGATRLIERLHIEEVRDK